MSRPEPSEQDRQIIDRYRKALEQIRNRQRMAWVWFLCGVPLAVVSVGLLTRSDKGAFVGFALGFVGTLILNHRSSQVRCPRCGELFNYLAITKPSTKFYWWRGPGSDHCINCGLGLTRIYLPNGQE